MLGHTCSLRFRAFVGHLEEQQIRQLLDVVAIAHPVVAEDVAIIPELLNNLRSLGGHVKGKCLERLPDSRSRSKTKTCHRS